MKVNIRDRHHNVEKQSRKFYWADITDNDFRPGAIVCLRHNGGKLVIAKQGAKGSWGLGFEHYPASFRSLPAEALFLILRRGNQIGFQCLGAEGRFIQACDRSQSWHSLAHGFGSQEAWESSDCCGGGGLVSAHYRSIELGAEIHPVTALPCSQLANWEDQVETQVQQLQSQLEARTQAAYESECHAADLVKAGARVAMKEQKEAEEMRSRLETSNRLALHWQEEAALAGEALRQAEVISQDLRRQIERGQGSLKSDSNGEIERLREEIASLRVEHDQKIQEIKEQHAAELAAALDNGGGGIEEHAQLVERLLEERARLDSALRCIKDMTRHMFSGDASDDEDDTCEAGHDVVMQQALESMAVGIPVEDTVDGSGAWSGSSFTLRPDRPLSAQSGSTVSDSAAVLDRLDTPGGEDVTFQMGVDAGSRPLSAALSLDRGKSAVAEVPEVYRFDASDSEDFASPANSIASGGGGGRRSNQSFHSCGSLNRVSVAGGGCFVVNYRGDRPDTVTESAMDRILDAPLPSQHRRVENMVNADAVASRMTSSGMRQSTVHTMTRNVRLMCPPCVSCPNSTAKSERLGDTDSPAVWAAGSLSLPGSNCVSPDAGQGPREPPEAVIRRRTQEENEEAEIFELRQRAIDITSAVEAMDKASPTAANLMAQYMADHVAVRASMPTLPFSKLRQSSVVPESPMIGGKIRAVHRSSLGTAAGAKAPRRSSFLDRPPIAETDLYGGRFP